MAEPRRQQQPHFLLLSFPAQGNINPTLQLAKRISHIGGGAARVTFSTTVFAHRRMFPAAGDSSADEAAAPPLISYSPYSDGYDDGYSGNGDDVGGHHEYMSKLKSVGSRTLADICATHAAAGRPVTCLIYNFMILWAADVARQLSIPSSALYWIQPATVFGIHYYYFHSHAELVASHRKDPWFSIELPGLPPLRIRDLPSPLISEGNWDGVVFSAVKELVQSLDRRIKESGEGEGCKKTKVLVNTFEALESEQIATVDAVDLVAIGPLLPSAYTDGEDQSDVVVGGDLLPADAKEKYMGWLDSKPVGSVVYVSFGSYSVLPPKQIEEISRGLWVSRRPYLWVARGSREEVTAAAEDGKQGMVVEWCSQVEVLSHPAVGCFVTHCGWNSTLESLVCGVPTVGLPQWIDQATNARLAEEWGFGVRAEPGSEEGVVEAAELRRCLDLVMGEGKKGVEIRKNARKWREKAREAAREGGPSDRNLRAFVEDVVGLLSTTHLNGFDNAF